MDDAAAHLSNDSEAKAGAKDRRQQIAPAVLASETRDAASCAALGLCRVD